MIKKRRKGRTVKPCTRPPKFGYFTKPCAGQEIDRKRKRSRAARKARRAQRGKA